jgi:NitT/TauT family transport system permease protein
MNIGASMYRFFCGYLSASALAIVLGLILGWFLPAWEFANPLVQFIRPISPVAWLPFIVLWFGIGDIPAIVIIAIAAFFPTLVSTVSAVQKIDPVYLKVAANFGVPQRKIITKIVFPVVFPSIMNGLRLAIGTAWVFLVVGEMVGAQSGLGYMIVDARNNIRLDQLMAAIIVIGIIGFILDTVVRYLEQLIAEKWGFGAQGKR